MYAEFLMAFTPFFLLFLGIIQLAILASGSLVVQHAAVKSARAAMVVLPDDPFFYDGEQTLMLDFRGTSDDSSYTDGLSGMLNDAGVPSPKSDTSGGPSSGTAQQGVGGPRLNAIRLAANLVLAPLAPEPFTLLSWVPSGLGLDAVTGKLPGTTSRLSLRNAAFGTTPAWRFLTGLFVYNSAAAAINFPEAPGSKVLRNSGKDFKGQVHYDPDDQVTVRVTYLLPCTVPIVNRLICPKINPGDNSGGIIGRIHRVGTAISSGGKNILENGKAQVQGAIDDVKDGVRNGKRAVTDVASCLRDDAAGLRDGLRQDATDLRDGIVNDARGLVDGLRDDATDLRDGLISDARNLGKDLKGDGKALATGIVTDGKNLYGGVKDDAKDLASGLKADGAGLGQTLGQGITDGAQGLPGGLQNDAQGLGKDLQNNGSQLGDTLTGLGKDAAKKVGACGVDSLARNAASGVNGVKNQAQQGADLGSLKDDALGVVRTTDAQGRQVLICLDQAGHEMVTTIDKAGNAIEQTVDASGNTIYTTLDAAGQRVQSTVSQTGERIDRTVDDAGNQVEITIDQAGNRVKTTIDDAGNRVVESVDSAKNRVITSYDTLGNRVETTFDRAGNRIDNAYDSVGNRVETLYDGTEQRVVTTYEGTVKRGENAIDAAGNCVQTGYDALGNALPATYTALGDRAGQLLDPESASDLLFGADPTLSPEEQALMNELRAGAKQPELLELLLRASNTRFHVVRREATLPLQSAPYRYPTWKKFDKDGKHGDS